jgi:hypothetical protein
MEQMARHVLVRVAEKPNKSFNRAKTRASCFGDEHVLYFTGCSALLAASDAATAMPLPVSCL